MPATVSKRRKQGKPWANNGCKPLNLTARLTSGRETDKKQAGFKTAWRRVSHVHMAVAGMLSVAGLEMLEEGGTPEKPSPGPGCLTNATAIQR